MTKQSVIVEVFDDYDVQTQEEEFNSFVQR